MSAADKITDAVNVELRRLWMLADAGGMTRREQNIAILGGTAALLESLPGADERHRIAFLALNELLAVMFDDDPTPRSERARRTT